MGERVASRIYCCDLARPMRADERVWTAKDIALVDGDTFKQSAHASKASNDRTANMPAKRRMTGTR